MIATGAVAESEPDHVERAKTNKSNPAARIAT